MAKHVAQKTRTKPAATRIPRGGIMRARGGGTNGAALAARAPAGTQALNLGADVSGQLEAIAPTFGEVLASIGDGVAASQAALDKSVVDTVKALAETNITVVSEVIEVLDDDGVPVPDETQLVSQNVSVLNYVTPTVHEWKHVAVGLDMQVSALTADSGISVTLDRSQSSIGTAGLIFGFIGVGYYSSSSSYQSMMANSSREASWASGQVNLDAVLAPRRTTKFPVPASVTIGPQIFFSQGAVVVKKAGDVVTGRSVDVLITVRKSNGDENPGVGLVVDTGGLLPSFKADGGYDGSTTNGDGQCLLTLTRDIPNPFFGRPAQRTVWVSLGDIRKSFQVTI